ncbi:MAG TPA: D-alanyl-D-alanine carboxypeptidase family protein [Solirubrobacterales bacterium]|nr:D-alanyl-D-alanine carboxypeptidase family protein [Solirubrobacterales bacterium]
MRVRRHGAAVALVTVLVGLLLPATGVAAPEQHEDRGQAPSHRPQNPQPGPHLAARSWALIDGRTGDVLVSHAGNRELPIASTTKLMTAYVAMKELPLDKLVRAQPYAAEYGESLMGLRSGQRISVRDLIYGLILRSGNDAAHTLAIAAAGSEARFVAEMNRYAAALGLSHSHFANPIGLDQKGNYASAFDLLTLTQRLLREPAFAKIAASRSAVLRSVHPRRRITTINELLELAPWATGVKTGHTFGAQYVLVGSGRRRGVDLISAVIGTWTDEERFDDSLELLEWGFGQYARRVPVRRGQDLADPEIRYSGGRLPLRAQRRLTVGLRHGQQLELRVRAPSEVEGPVARGEKLGRAFVLVDGRPAGTVPLLAARAVPKASAFDRARSFAEDNLALIGVVAFVILMVLVALWRLLARDNKQGSRIG